VTAVDASTRWVTDHGAVADLLVRIRAWTPLDGPALLDDVALVLDEGPPAEEQAEEIAERLRGYLMQLVNIALAGGADRGSAYAGVLIQRARALRVEEMPGDSRRAVLHLRQLGWVTGELLDQLVVLHYVKEAA
jgi:hypothetical protein